jgi:hypothetical protein
VRCPASYKFKLNDIIFEYNLSNQQWTESDTDQHNFSLDDLGDTGLIFSIIEDESIWYIDSFTAKPYQLANVIHVSSPFSNNSIIIKGTS